MPTTRRNSCRRIAIARSFNVGEDPSCSASVVVASGVDDHASYMGESFAAKHLECALAPSTPKALEAAAKALAA